MNQKKERMNGRTKNHGRTFTRPTHRCSICAVTQQFVQPDPPTYHQQTKQPRPPPSPRQQRRRPRPPPRPRRAPRPRRRRRRGGRRAGGRSKGRGGGCGWMDGCRERGGGVRNDGDPRLFGGRRQTKTPIKVCLWGREGLYGCRGWKGARNPALGWFGRDGCVFLSPRLILVAQDVRTGGGEGRERMARPPRWVTKQTMDKPQKTGERRDDGRRFKSMGPGRGRAALVF